MSRSRSSRRPKVLGVAALVVAIVGVGGATMALRAQDEDVSAPAGSSSPNGPTSSATTVPAGDPSSTRVDPPPPDPDDVATDTATPDGVSVQITFASVDDAAGAVVVGAYVAGVIEDDGTCSLVLTRGGQTARAQSTASADASHTTCGQLQVPTSEVSSGSWQAVVSYVSAAGGSPVTASTTVDVP